MLTTDVCESWYPGKLCCDLNNRIHILRVSFGIPKSIVDKNDSLKFLRCSIGYLILFLNGLRLHKKRKVDCVFSQHHSFHLATFTASLLSFFLGVPHIIKIQDVVPWCERFLEKPYIFFIDILNRYAFKHAKYVLTLSTELEYLVKKSFQITDAQSVVIPNTVQVHTCEVNEFSVEKLKSKLQLGGYRILIFVGSTKGRGLKLLIKALPYVISRTKKVRLLIVGYAHNRDELESLANSLNVGQYVKFTGPVEHSFVPVLISMSEVAIGPLHSSPVTIGAVPRKVLEYMACSKPVIAAYNTVSNDLLVNGYNGIFVREDSRELADALIKLLRDKDLANRLGKNAKLHVNKYFSSNVLRERLSHILKSIGSGKQ